MKDIIDSSLVHPLPDGLLESYFSYLIPDASSRYSLKYLHSIKPILIFYRKLNSSTRLRFVNTSMHGVSNSYVSKAFEVVGLSPFIPVENQKLPDSKFPTVKFPNPEENGKTYIIYHENHS